MKLLRFVLDLGLFFAVSLTVSKVFAADWNQWRGPNREANSAVLPDILPEPPLVIWEQKLDGDGLSGVVASEKFVVIADRDKSDMADIFKCYNSETGEELWRFEYSTPSKIDPDYGSSPRAAPLIWKDKVYLLGGFGNFHCLEIETGKQIWKTHLARDFGALMPKWGYSVSPLIVEIEGSGNLENAPSFKYVKDSGS
ncbi:MAG: PQQ-binding-like beta-propeller repeat protein, partial [Thermoguttaceae bacterium]